MSYLFLSLVLLSGAAKGYCGKKTSGFAEHFYDAVYMNIVRFAICVFIGAVLCLLQKGFGSFSRIGAVIALLSGAAQAGFVTTWLMAVRKGSYTMLDAFLALGILIPSILCEIFFDEQISILQWLGFVLLLIAVYIMCSYSNKIKGKMDIKAFFILLCCGIFNGIADFSQKLFVKFADGESVAVFNFYSYLFAAIVLVIAFVFIKPRAEKPCSIKSFGIYILIMSVCLFANSYFKTMAGKSLSAFEIYPVCQGGGMILSIIMAAVFFKEPVTKLNILGMSLTFVSLMIIVFF